MQYYTPLLCCADGTLFFSSYQGCCRDECCLLILFAPTALRPSASPTRRTTTTPTVLSQAGQTATATYRCSLSRASLISRLHNKPEHANDQQQQHNMVTAATQKPHTINTHTPLYNTYHPPRKGGYSLQKVTLLFCPPPPRSPYMQNNCNRTRKTIVAPQQSSDSVGY